MTRYKQSRIARSLTQVWLVFVLIWLANLTSATADQAEVENTNPMLVEMPHLSEAQRRIVVDALHLNNHVPHPTCSFELDAKLDYIPSRIERYDPRSDKESPWTLISIEDREPSERERKKTPRYTRSSPEEMWSDLRQNIKWESLKVVNESEERISFIGLKDLQVGRDEFVTSDLTLEINKVTRSIETVTITMKGTHKINFFATIAAMKMTQNYRYEPEMDRSILEQMFVDWKFKFFFAPASSTEHLTYRDYDCQLPN